MNQPAFQHPGLTASPPPLTTPTTRTPFVPPHRRPFSMDGMVQVATPHPQVHQRPMSVDAYQPPVIGYQPAPSPAPTSPSVVSQPNMSVKQAIPVKIIEVSPAAPKPTNTASRTESPIMHTIKVDSRLTSLWTLTLCFLTAAFGVALIVGRSYFDDSCLDTKILPGGKSTAFALFGISAILLRAVMESATVGLIELLTTRALVRGHPLLPLLASLHPRTRRRNKGGFINQVQAVFLTLALCSTTYGIGYKYLISDVATLKNQDLQVAAASYCIGCGHPDGNKRVDGMLTIASMRNGTGPNNRQNSGATYGDFYKDNTMYAFQLPRQTELLRELGTDSRIRIDGNFGLRATLEPDACPTLSGNDTAPYSEWRFLRTYIQKIDNTTFRATAINGTDCEASKISLSYIFLDVTWIQTPSGLRSQALTPRDLIPSTRLDFAMEIMQGLNGVVNSEVVNVFMNSTEVWTPGASRVVATVTFVMQSMEMLLHRDRLDDDLKQYEIRTLRPNTLEARNGSCIALSFWCYVAGGVLVVVGALCVALELSHAARIVSAAPLQWLSMVDRDRRGGGDDWAFGCCTGHNVVIGDKVARLVEEKVADAEEIEGSDEYYHLKVVGAQTAGSHPEFGNKRYAGDLRRREKVEVLRDEQGAS
ncbi:hypothetical protein HDV00_002747 [Rhizophlyctis rosea]|nr:hypothetical protein HDV00_002747 [Rhizophlyctis rosea]